MKDGIQGMIIGTMIIGVVDLQQKLYGILKLHLE